MLPSSDACKLGLCIPPAATSRSLTAESVSGLSVSMNPSATCSVCKISRPMALCSFPSLAVLFERSARVYYYSKGIETSRGTGLGEGISEEGAATGKVGGFGLAYLLRSALAPCWARSPSAGRQVQARESYSSRGTPIMSTRFVVLTCVASRTVLSWPLPEERRSWLGPRSTSLQPRREL